MYQEAKTYFEWWRYSWKRGKAIVTACQYVWAGVSLGTIESRKQIDHDDTINP